jgi:hypothetical protein
MSQSHMESDTRDDKRLILSVPFPGAAQTDPTRKRLAITNVISIISQRETGRCGRSIRGPLAIR